MLDAPPMTLNPRMTQDAQGQRLAAILFPALTKIDARLSVQGALAESFSSDPHGLEWKFQIRSNLRDHTGSPIGAAELFECFNHYRQTPPLAVAIQALQNWKSLRVVGKSLVFLLEKPDPYFSRNVTLLRYFRQEGRPPCTHPEPNLPLIGAGDFRAQTFSRPPDSELQIDKLQPDGSFRPHARIIFVRDENTRLLRMLRGEADLAQNAFAPVRFRWLASRHGDRFRLVEAPGVNVSYLSFNTRHPILSNVKVRRALSLAIPVSDLIRGKFASMVEPASSFLSPLLADASTPALERENPQKTEQLLDEAGYPRKKDGVRFTLRFKTTPVREGFEPARILQEVFGRLGVALELEVVEPSVFLAAVRQGAYELALGRWIGVADPTILERALRTGSLFNRAGYSDPQMDLLLERQQWRLAQEKMAADLPYFPLWHWKNAVLVRKGTVEIEPSQISLTGALGPLLEARRKE